MYPTGQAGTGRGRRHRNMLVFDNSPVSDYAPDRLHLGRLTDPAPGCPAWR